MRILDLGLIPYADALKEQEQAALRVLAHQEESLFLLEHPAVITFGRNGGEENLPLDREFFAARGVDIVHSTRGGNITCHFPGQLVVYPIMRLDKRPGGLRRFFADLEETVIRTLAFFGLTAARMEKRPGVWIADRKICSIGIAVKHWVSRHGLALNVGRDLSLFDLVAPCGLPGVTATSLQRELTDNSMDMDKVKSVFVREFLDVFRITGDACRELSSERAEPSDAKRVRFCDREPDPVRTEPPAQNSAAACCPAPDPVQTDPPAAPFSRRVGSALDPERAEPPLRLPPWLRRPLPTSRNFAHTRALIEGHKLATVCKGARCPNMHECFSRGTATFMILGETCTRSCAFCNIRPGKPGPPDPGEAERVARAAAELGLGHVVITSVTRDDLPDGGAGHFAAVMKAVRARLPKSGIEVLIPDFQGSKSALDTVIAAGPHIVNHNVETHPALYGSIRPQADYERSLELIRRARAKGVTTKSGFMVGLGEDDGQVRELLCDLKNAGCDIVTIGQYMRPGKAHPPVRRYVHPDIFAAYAAYGKEQGLTQVFSAPLVRSSYLAQEALLKMSNVPF